MKNNSGCSRKRSIAKSITWRILASLTTIILVFLFFGRIDLALSLGAIEVIAKLILYYGHERGWNKIGWDK